MNDLKNKTVLVTGGAGFIGSHLCEKLLAMGANVICFDNFFTGKRENVIHLEDNGSFFLVTGDANKRADLEAVFKAREIDFIFHYAAVLGVQRVTEDPLSVLKDVDGLRHIMDLAREHKVKKVVFASSSEAYGFSSSLPLREDGGQEWAGNQSGRVHLYALVKLMGEKIMKIYNDHYGVPAVSLRFFNVYGPRQESSAYGFVVGVFIKQILKGEAPTVFGDGYQTRDFIYVGDNVRLAVMALLEEKTAGEVINIGTGRQTSIIDLAERLIRLSGKSLRPKIVPGREYEIKYRTPDTAKMKTLLNEVIGDNLEENLKHTYDWYKERNGA